MFMTLGLGSSDTPSNVAKFVELGAKEFFIGYVPRAWLDKFGWEIGPNRRTMGPAYNYSNVSELRDIVKGIHDCGGTVNLAVNAHDNGADRMGMVHDMLDLFETLNPDGYIVADPAVMYCMKKWGITREMHISTGVGCFNSESVRFFCEEFKNITRLVIPRKLTINEMKSIIDGLKDLNLEYEVMIIGYRCYFNDEDCHSIHSGKRRNLCGDVLSAHFTSTNRFPSNWKDVVEYMIEHPRESLNEGSPVDKFRKEWLATIPPAYPSFDYKCAGCQGVDGELAHLMFQTCGLCAIKYLKRIGVEALKVPLRGDEETKLNVVRTVSQVMNAENPTRAFCRSLINSDSFCNSKFSCYYEVPEEDK